MEIDCMTGTWKKKELGRKIRNEQSELRVERNIMQKCNKAFKSFVHKQVLLCNKYLE